MQLNFPKIDNFREDLSIVNFTSTKTLVSMCFLFNFNYLALVKIIEFTNTYAYIQNNTLILEIFDVKYYFSVICSITKNMLMCFLGDFVNFTSANFYFLSDPHDCKQCPGGENWQFTPPPRHL